ncbi:NifU family protein [Sinomicrobium weinanense]|uniref:NifU family protein n=1 Tax=Sinomicrobium weinanense TaxID=2842200 RepID=A0A926Q3Q3_9FLAO|nr:NifU family protein [Sinomicrobium weinanense]MBC9797798.1 NifU family protein [Sinomicrobium weinanense]MBU3124882.1 NifU family protein [Sinomicrobium weinanense]
MEKTTIKIQPTNNPAIIKFEASRFLLEQQSYEYKNIDEARNSPLAQQLFYLPFVKTVFISGNFVAVERYNIVEWEEVQAEIADQIEHYLNSGQPVVKVEEKEQKLPYTIYAESTPNPAVMKFVANKKLVDSIFEFKNIDEAKDAPIAQALFHFPFVKEVFLDENYISITKYDIADWNDITMELREYIWVYLEEGKTIVAEGIKEQKTNKNTIASPQHSENLGETSKQIIDIIEEYIKPAVASDGGNILFESYDENDKTVKLILQGACSGCPSSTFTLKNGIETMLKEMLHDKVNEVVAING